MPVLNKELQRTETSEQPNDDKLLAKWGYKQELKRDFSVFEVFGLSFTIVGVLPSIASVLVYALPNGGPVALLWGWAVCSIFLMFIALAMAELGSAAPLAGGLYYWTHMYSTPRWRNILSWIVGYSNTISYVAAIAGVDWSCAVQILACVSIGTDMAYTPTVYQTYGTFCAILVVHMILSSAATKVLARLMNIYAAINVLLCLAVIISIPAATPKEYKNTADFAFGNFQNFTGWTNGYAFVLSFLAPLWTVGGFDSSLHISEEARNANVAVPWAVMMATAIGCILGWVINLVLVFNMGTDLESIINNSIGQPMVTIFANSFGKKGTLAIWSFVILTQFIMGNACLTTVSRQMWAFSRDRALPFSGFLYRINKYTHTPVNCVWFSGLCAACLCLLAFANNAAIEAVFTLAVVGQYVAYMIPIAARFLGGQPFTPGVFNLRAFSIPVAVIAVLWMFFCVIIMLFPSSPQVEAPNMNYTIVVFGGVMVIALVWYYFPKYGGMYWFNGPVSNIDRNGEDTIVYEVEQKYSSTAPNGSYEGSSDDAHLRI